MSKSLTSTNTDPAFWDEQWKNNHIGFHKKDINS
jgi:hypothetical protein